MTEADRRAQAAAERRAEQIVRQAWERAEQLQEEALAELQQEIDRRLRDAAAAGDRIRHAGERAAASARADAEAERERARRELDAEAEAFWARTRDEADGVLREARETAVRVLAEAAAEAARIRALATGLTPSAPGRAPALRRADPVEATPAAEESRPAVEEEEPADPDPGVPHVLLVCTGNVRRSPLAGALLRRALQDAGVDARVSSAGLLEEGEPASRTVVEVAAGRGLDLSGHRSRRVTTDELRVADLIIGMERAHVREAVVRADDVFARAFTLRELVTRADACGPRDPDEPFDAWLARVHEGRELDDLLVADDADDIADPDGASTRRAARTADEIERLVRHFVALAWGGVDGPETVGRDTLPWADADGQDHGAERGLLRRILRR